MAWWKRPLKQTCLLLALFPFLILAVVWYVRATQDPAMTRTGLQRAEPIWEAVSFVWTFTLTAVWAFPGMKKRLTVQSSRRSENQPAEQQRDAKQSEA